MVPTCLIKQEFTFLRWRYSWDEINIEASRHTLSFRLHYNVRSTSQPVESLKKTTTTKVSQRGRNSASWLPLNQECAFIFCQNFEISMLLIFLAFFQTCHNFIPYISVCGCGCVYTVCVQFLWGNSNTDKTKILFPNHLNKLYWHCFGNNKILQTSIRMSFPNWAKHWNMHGLF